MAAHIVGSIPHVVHCNAFIWPQERILQFFKAYV